MAFVGLHNAGDLQGGGRVCIAPVLLVVSVNVATFVDVIGDYLLVCIQLDHTEIGFGPWEAEQFDLNFKPWRHCWLTPILNVAILLTTVLLTPTTDYTLEISLDGNCRF
jgi:hypothetical protein